MSDNVSTRKVKTLNIGDKLKIIKLVGEGKRKKKDIAVDFNIPCSTLSTILKNKEEIQQRAIEGNLKCKRKRNAEFKDVEECMIKWFKQCREKNITLGGPLIREKAEHFARSLGHIEFKASNGWLENFKKRHNIFFKKVCGESGAVDDDVVVDWKASLPDLIKDYDPKNVFNADETALFFKCLPDKTYEIKEKKCHGGKHSKERITLLLASNMTGTNMLKPLVIGKSKKPRCFAGVKSLTVDYTANRKAWMNAEMFADWLLKLDKQMGKGKRNIILFIDNCSAHNTIPELKWVKVQFLPANTTSKLQPLDQGIIKNFKVLYRTEVVRRFVADIEDGKECSINLLQAMRLIDKC
ncbi:tigger transposable element-derived protein 4-like [Homalodisca vitripennis]|uniref:tigger transposable element-derived protein 4-like n=1 Tax=Homalodisca vitripennis TaxID=197043 RepID=UPI001EEAAAF3|nr:tigger transposable element-derived protein 4-like [Homalodisca vitripennis]